MATAPEQDKPKRTRSANKPKAYDVFQMDSATGHWDRIDEGIEVNARGEDERRKEAIAIATMGVSENEKVGTFATCPAGEFVVKTRQRKAEPVDIWE